MLVSRDDVEIDLRVLGDEAREVWRQIAIREVVGGCLARNNDGPLAHQLMWWGHARLAGICMGFALRKNMS